MQPNFDLHSYLKSLEGQSLKTLSDVERFSVIELKNDTLVIRVAATDKERQIPVSEIETAFRRLVSQGQLSRVEVNKKISPRNPAYVVAILANIPNVDYQVEPVIELFYKKIG